MFLIQHHSFHQNLFYHLVFIILFPRWHVTRLFRTAKLYNMPCVTGSSSESNIQTIEIIFHYFSWTSSGIHLDLGSPSYIDFLQVSCLGMNSGRGWNHNLDGSYLPEYREYETEFFTQCTSGFYLWPMQVSADETSPILGYSEFPKTYHF